MKSSSITRPRKKPKLELEKEEKNDITDLLEAETEPVQYHCDYCRKDISNSVRISCAICTEFDLCLECFSVGVELRGHKNDHDYRVIDDMHFPFLTRDWSAEEEQLLLEGLELYGIGNWADVSDHVSTKDKAACREHYEKYYLSSKTWPEPDYSQLLCTREKVKLLNSGRYNKIKRKDGIVVKKEVTPKIKPGSKKKQQSNQAIHATSAIPPDFNGFMPMRDEFETEYDNDCENKIKDLGFLDDDTPEEIQMKIKLLEIHNYRLQIRKKWRDFVVSRNLHDTKLQKKLLKNRTKEQKTVYKNLLRFLQIMEPNEHEEFIKGLDKERQLKARIKALQNYRSKGIRTLDEINAYEMEEEKRQKLSQSKHRKHKAPVLDLTGHPGTDFLSTHETQLCTQLQILPNDYMFTKETFLHEYLKTGELNLEKIEELSTLVSSQDYIKLKTVFEFLQQVGWINSKHHLNNTHSTVSSNNNKKPKSPSESLSLNNSHCSSNSNTSIQNSPATESRRKN